MSTKRPRVLSINLAPSERFRAEGVALPSLPEVVDVRALIQTFSGPKWALAFAVTSNKAQGQSLELCGLYLHTDCFSHGQSYVASSRVGNPDNLFIYTENGTTKNIVYPQVLEN